MQIKAVEDGITADAKMPSGTTQNDLFLRGKTNREEWEELLLSLERDAAPALPREPAASSTFPTHVIFMPRVALSGNNGPVVLWPFQYSGTFLTIHFWMGSCSYMHPAVTDTSQVPLRELSAELYYCDDFTNEWKWRCWLRLFSYYVGN